MLGHVADEGTRVDIVVGLGSHHFGSALCGLKQAEEELDCCAFPRAVGAQETRNAITDGKCNVVESEDSTVALREIGRF